MGALLGPAQGWAGGRALDRVRVIQDMRALAAASNFCAHRWSVGRSHMALDGLPESAQLGGWALVLFCHRQLPRALRSANRGAKLNDPLSEAILGNIEGAGIPGMLPANAVASFRWNLASARQGFPMGEYQLGLDLWHGTGGPPDAPRAMRWMKRAAASGWQEAQRWLARHETNSPLPRVAASTPAPPPAVQPAVPEAGSPATAPPATDGEQRLRSLERFWRLYFRASDAKVVDFGAPALVRPVQFGGPP